MALYGYFRDIYIDSDGSPVKGAEVYIRPVGSAGLATIYQRSSGSIIQVAQPVLTDIAGDFSFYAAPGEYTITLQGGITRNVVCAELDPSGGAVAYVWTSDEARLKKPSGAEFEPASVDYADSARDSAVSESREYADSVSSAAEAGARTYADSAALTAENNAKSFASSEVSAHASELAGASGASLIGTASGVSLSVELATIKEAQQSGVVGFSTVALMSADLAHPASTVALVTNDPTPANNTYYLKSGASGSGSWTVASDSYIVELQQTTAVASDSANAAIDRLDVGILTFSDMPPGIGLSSAYGEVSGLTLNVVTATGEDGADISAISETITYDVPPGVTFGDVTLTSDSKVISGMTQNGQRMVPWVENQAGFIAPGINSNNRMRLYYSDSAATLQVSYGGPKEHHSVTGVRKQGISNAQRVGAPQYPGSYCVSGPVYAPNYVSTIYSVAQTEHLLDISVGQSLSMGTVTNTSTTDTYDPLAYLTDAEFPDVYMLGMVSPMADNHNAKLVAGALGTTLTPAHARQSTYPQFNNDPPVLGLMYENYLRDPYRRTRGGWVCGRGGTARWALSKPPTTLDATYSILSDATLLFASGSHMAVTADTYANNGVYIKYGALGAGGWQKVAELFSTSLANATSAASTATLTNIPANSYCLIIGDGANDGIYYRSTNTTGVLWAKIYVYENHVTMAADYYSAASTQFSGKTLRVDTFYINQGEQDLNRATSLEGMKAITAKMVSDYTTMLNAAGFTTTNMRVILQQSSGLVGGVSGPAAQVALDLAKSGAPYIMTCGQWDVNYSDAYHPYSPDYQYIGAQAAMSRWDFERTGRRIGGFYIASVTGSGTTRTVTFDTGNRGSIELDPEITDPGYYGFSVSGITNGATLTGASLGSNGKSVVLTFSAAPTTTGTMYIEMAWRGTGYPGKTTGARSPLCIYQEDADGCTFRQRRLKPAIEQFAFT